MGELTYAKTVHVPLYKQLYSILWTIVMMLTAENLILVPFWYRWFSKNPQSEVTGPAYVFGAPERSIAPGKGILANKEELKLNAPFLFKLRILSPFGKPLANAKVDLWEANSFGEYSYRSYFLRGKFTSDENGIVECLAVCPGIYGIAGLMRPGHFHLYVTPGPQDIKSVKPFTTQPYVCAANDPKWLEKDGFNGVWLGREPPIALLSQCYSLPFLPSAKLLSTPHTPTSPDSKRFMDFPSLEEKLGGSLTEGERRHLGALKASVDWWESKLNADGLSLSAVGELTIHLDKR